MQSTLFLAYWGLRRACGHFFDRGPRSMGGCCGRRSGFGGRCRTVAAAAGAHLLLDLPWGLPTKASLSADIKYTAILAVLQVAHIFRHSSGGGTPL